jgi:murein DD-endopeptidase MepM/ murein hydrolase activator NlpD
MQILIMTGPHSKVREISLTARHLVFGGALSLALLVGANIAINDMANETKDLLQAMEKKELIEKRFVAHSEDDYETKLMELQARLDEAQRNLAQLDDLRIQLARNGGQLNVASNSSYPNTVIDLGNAQGGPLSPANAAINLGNQGEQYGARLDRTVQDSIALSNRVGEMQKSLTQTWDVANTLPTGLPLPLMPQASSGLGYRIDPITQQTAWHEGTDFPAAYGTPIQATAEGVVSRAAFDPEYGYVVDIAHKNGVVTRYAHAQEILVKQGEYVKQGQTVARVGSTGRSTGPHLHYEVLRDGVTVGALGSK